MSLNHATTIQAGIGSDSLESEQAVPLAQSKSGLKNLFLLYAFFLYFSAVFQALLMVTGVTGTVGLKNVFIYTPILLLVPLWLPAITRFWAWGFGLIMWAFSLLKLGYFAIFGQELSESVFFAVFETDITEGSEFLEVYFRWWILLALVIYSIVPIWLACRIKPIKTTRRTKYIVSIAIMLSLLEPIVSRGKWQGWNCQSVQPVTNRLMKRCSSLTPWQSIIRVLLPISCCTSGRMPG